MLQTKQTAEISQLHRLQGQLSGIEKIIVRNGSLCDLLQQIEAVRGSLLALERQLLIKKVRQVKDDEFKKACGYLLKVA